MSSLGSQLFAAEFYVYYNNGIPIYRSTYEIKPFFEFTSIAKFSWEMPKAQLIKIRSGKVPVVLVHGIDPMEIYGVWTDYKKKFIEAWKRLLPNNFALYIFIYPSLDVPIEDSAEIFFEEVSKLEGKVNIYAHSMGGILLRYALQREELVKKISKIIFAGTPHIGSPLANFVVADKDILKLRSDWEFIKTVLLIANVSGGFTQAPNYKYISIGFENPQIPENVHFVNFAARIKNDAATTVSNLLNTEFFTSFGLESLNRVTKILYPPNSEFVENDGMVPLSSAIYFGNAKIFDGYDHSDLAYYDIIVNEAIKEFSLTEVTEQQ
ncbi:MAG: esterase/lipase family protein [Fervidobacterium sp.]